MAVYPGQATSWIYSPGCNRGKTTWFLVGNCLLKSCSPDGDWQLGCGVDPSNKPYKYIYIYMYIERLEVQSAKQSGWPLGWSMDSGFPILPRGSSFGRLGLPGYKCNISEMRHKKKQTEKFLSYVILHVSFEKAYQKDDRKSFDTHRFTLRNLGSLRALTTWKWTPLK